MRVITVLLFLCGVFNGFGQSTVTINAPFFKNEPVTIYTHVNELTQKDTLQKKAVFDSSGVAQFTINGNTHAWWHVKIELRTITFLLVPNTQLEINIDSVLDGENQSLPMPFRYHYSNCPEYIASPAVYQRITYEFDSVFISLLGRPNSKQVLDSIILEMDQEMNYLLKKDLLFSTFYKYQKALEYWRFDYSKQELRNTYIKNNPINYQSANCLLFFQTSMEPWAFKVLSKNKVAVERVKNKYSIYKELIALLASNSDVYTAEQLNLSLYYLLKNKGYKSFFTSEQRLSILSQMANEAPFMEIRSAALQLFKKSNLLKAGVEAPLFTLSDLNNDAVSLESFRSKYVYLCFMNSSSSTCQKHFLALKALAKSFPKLKVVIVFVDRDSINPFFEKNNQKHFTLLQLQKKYTVLEQYQVFEYPLYYLINDFGYFIEAPAKGPTEISSSLMPIYNKRRTKRPYEIMHD